MEVVLYVATLSARRTRGGKLPSWVCVGGDRGAITGSAGHPSALTLRLRRPITSPPSSHEPHGGLSQAVSRFPHMESFGFSFVLSVHLQA